MHLTSAVSRAPADPHPEAFENAPDIALGDLYDRHAARACALAAAICLDPGRVERAVTEAFLVLASDSFALPERPATLPRLLVTTYRHAVDEARWSGQVYLPFRGVTPEQAEALALARFGQLNLAQIAGAVGRSGDQVKRVLRDGLRALH